MTPFGYEMEDGIVRIKEEEAAIVREVFQKYISGRTDIAFPRTDRQKDSPFPMPHRLE